MTSRQPAEGRLQSIGRHGLRHRQAVLPLARLHSKHKSRLVACNVLGHTLERFVPTPELESMQSRGGP